MATYQSRHAYMLILALVLSLSFSCVDSLDSRDLYHNKGKDFNEESCLNTQAVSCSLAAPCCSGLICNPFRGYSQCVPPSAVFSPTASSLVTSSPFLGPTIAPSQAPSTGEPSALPTAAPVPFGTYLWANLPGVSFARSTYTVWPPSRVANLAACQALCNSLLRCDFITFNLATLTCGPIDFEKTAYSQSTFSGQHFGTYVPGELRFGNNTLQSTIMSGSTDSCNSLCTENPVCQYSTFNTYTGICQQWSFQSTPNHVISFRLNPLPFNYNPLALGRHDYIGNSGVVCIMMNMLPNDKVLCTARPEYFRGWPGPIVPNPDNLSPDPNRLAVVPYGEIASIYDPISGIHVPSQINDNIFCHGTVLMNDGILFTAGGDDGATGAAQGLNYALNKQRTFDYTTNTWTYGNTLWRVRWYPTIIRAPRGLVFIFGGMLNGNGQPQRNFEIWNPVANTNTLSVDPVRLFDFTGTTGYPQAAVIPGQGNIWVFSLNRWSVYDQTTGAELENEFTGAVDQINGNFLAGFRSGATPAAGIVLPMIGSNPTVAEFILFGGASSYTDPYQHALTNCPRFSLNAPSGQKAWTIDPLDLMPYGRVVSDAVIQPNGKILIFNGAQLGVTGGQIGVPYMFGAALDVFCYDPQAPSGKRFTVFAANEFQHFYHSVAGLLSDGRTLQMATDEASYDRTTGTAYNHRVFAFTPPWLLNGVPRPVIVSISNNDGTVGNPNPLISSNNGIIYYGKTFTVTYTGTVTGISIMTPNAGTHGTEFSQRMIFPDYIRSSKTTLLVTAPANPTILIQGYHMVWLLNGDTPSKANWIRLMETP